MTRSPRILLASSSPRRHRLLSQLGLDFDVIAPDIDESVLPGEDALVYVRRLAAAKAHAVAADPDVLVIAADTTVDLDGEILGKPVDPDDARRMLRALAGRTHEAHTGVALRLHGRELVGVDTTRVTMTPISPAAIEWYVGTGEPLDAAAAYALQGAGGVFVERITGSVSNVVGLPLHLLARLTASLGVELVG